MKNLSPKTSHKDTSNLRFAALRKASCLQTPRNPRALARCFFQRFCPVTVFAALLLSGCRNAFFEKPELPPSQGTGAFILKLDGYERARTILPQNEDYALDEFDIVMTFTPTVGASFDITWIDDTTPVELPVGTYDLVVSAYNKWLNSDGEPAAMSESQPITIGSGVTTATVTLSLIQTGGEGLFSWGINWGSMTITSVRIIITDLDGDPADGSPFDIFDNLPEIKKSCTLPIGFYRVTFELVNDEGHQAVRKEILHIYKNMDSHFDWTLSAQNFFGAPGSAANPFIVYDEETLRKVGTESTAGGWTLDAHYLQTDDIPLAGNWTPIGDYTTPFSGVYDGGGKTISNLISSQNGLFGFLTGTARNVNLSGVSITRNNNYAGGIAGEIDNNATIINCSVTGTVTGTVTGGTSGNAGGIAGYIYTGTIENCWSSGTIEDSNTNTGRTGGIVGYNEAGTIKNCYSTANVTGGSIAGGIVGFNESGTTENCYSTGSVKGGSAGTGGIAGKNADTIQNSVALGASVDGTPNVARVVGENSQSVSMTNNYGRGEMLVNYNTAGGGFPVTTITTGRDGKNITSDDWEGPNWWQYNGSDADSGGPGFDFSDPDGAWEWGPTDLPILKGFAPGTQNPQIQYAPGSAEDPFIVASKEDLQKIGVDPAWGLNKHYKLEADIDLSGIPNWTPIGFRSGNPDNPTPFTGTFDGGGFAVDYLSINSSNMRAGLFGIIGLNGKVQNLGVTNVNVNGGEETGGLAGQVDTGGIIDNCYVSGTVSGGDYVGGITGGGGGIIENCYSTAEVSGGGYAGGIAGNSWGAIRNCYSTGAVSAAGDHAGGIAAQLAASGTIERCYSTGAVSAAGNNAGGIVGNHFSATAAVTNCVALNPSVSGASNVGRVAGNAVGTLTNNYGRDEMVLTGDTLTVDAGLKDGADVTKDSWETPVFWGITAGFVFDPDTGPWQWNSATKLPILRNVGGVQNPQVQLVIEMVKINAGTFTMGSEDPSDVNGMCSASPSHEVTLTQGFYMGKYQVTQEQYEAVMGTNPSYFTTGVTAGEVQEKRPVENVTWYDAVEFCNKLSVMEGLEPVYAISGRSPASGYPITGATVTADISKNGYRLPTEAQWEYACRAGTTTAYYTENDADAALQAAAWYSANAGDKTHEVGLKTANPWGLYDMMGNVGEWCWDRRGDGFYDSGSQIDPQGADVGNRVTRGGCYYTSNAQELHSAYRNADPPSTKNSTTGFRLVRPLQN